MEMHINTPELKGVMIIRADGCPESYNASARWDQNKGYEVLAWVKTARNVYGYFRPQGCDEIILHKVPHKPDFSFTAGRDGHSGKVWMIIRGLKRTEAGWKDASEAACRKLQTLIEPLIAQFLVRERFEQLVQETACESFDIGVKKAQDVAEAAQAVADDLRLTAAQIRRG